MKDVLPPLAVRARHEAHSPAELAARFGLTASDARPGLGDNLRGLWARRHFVLAYSRARFDARYGGTRLGGLWHLATPLLNAAVCFLVFGLVLRAGGDMPARVYVPFLVTGVFVFAGTQDALLSGPRAVSGSRELVRALRFPRAALPLACALRQARQLPYSMAVVLLVVVCAGGRPGPAWLLAVPGLLLQFLFNTGLTLFLARLGSRGPDLAQLMPFVSRTLLYASGVVYSVPAAVAGQPAWIAEPLRWNPAALYLDLVRSALVDGYGPDRLPPFAWATATAWAVAVCGAGYVFFWRAEGTYGRG